VRWLNVLKALTCHRLLDPGGEFRFHRQWYDRSAPGNLPGESPAIAGKNMLYLIFRSSANGVPHLLGFFDFWADFLHYISDSFCAGGEDQTQAIEHDGRVVLRSAYGPKAQVRSRPCREHHVE
jgi:hypothetical protein